MDSKKKQSRYFQKLDKKDIEANFNDLKERFKLTQFPPKGDKYPAHKEAIVIEGYKIPVHADILEPTRNNPLFELLDFPSVPKLKAYIKKHRQHLKKMQAYHLKTFLYSLSAKPLNEQRDIINDCISKATTRRNSKSLAGEELTEWDKAFEETILEERKRIEDLLEGEAAESLKEEPNLPDPTTDKIIKLATDGRKVQRKHKKHARKFMAEYALIKNNFPELSIEGYIEEVGMTKVSTNSYRDWIEKFDKAEEMLSNVE